MSTLTFYNDVCDPLSQSMKLLLAANEIPHKTVEIGDSEESAGIQNGKGRADSYLEALKVLEAEMKNDYDATDREKQMKILKYFVEYVQPLFYRTVLTGHPREGLDLFFEALSPLENAVVMAPGPYFGGKSPCFLDYGLYPWLEKIGSWIPNVKAFECVGLQAWLRRMRNEPVVTKVMPACDLTLLNTYKKSLEHRMAGTV